MAIDWDKDAHILLPSLPPPKDNEKLVPPFIGSTPAKGTDQSRSPHTTHTSDSFEGKTEQKKTGRYVKANKKKSNALPPIEDKKPRKRSNKIYTKDQKEQLRDLFMEHGDAWKMGRYSNETGIKEDYCRRLVGSIKKGADITNKKKRGPPPKHSLELLKEIVDVVKVKGKSTREASKQLKVSPSSICRYMKSLEAQEMIEETQHKQEKKEGGVQESVLHIDHSIGSIKKERIEPSSSKE
ncbi:hypothetical protein EIN_091950 [Entamoeba invadens IP1]|uniref:Uncharacterized protein n=1 Tax=Entamoeba invadens IP1 TaxID=370355 RepID=A0A0A1U4J4_ENTIV|nr:hypothetical protein EIN_091950 [Entamoeba invadens IP1]ELP86630.1 hypothetical protein EIN_091950 [Entamoeba invadens IP1]|eukprot:XP_004185976.1 hypothetical protein EIN_091950 [Entamoeba invadens IP1]